MIRILVFLLLIPVVVLPQTTAQDLIDGFRIRTGQTDTTRSYYTDAHVLYFLDQAQQKMSRLTGYIRRSHSIIYQDDSLCYTLPSQFKMIRDQQGDGVMVYNGGMWHTVLRNQNFAEDSRKFQYSVGWDSVGEARIYLKGMFIEDDTVRVFYRAKPNALDSVTDTIEVDTDMEVYVVEEAVAMFEQASRAHDIQMALQVQTRRDLGLIVTEEK
jgi:hypothetical protein